YWAPCPFHQEKTASFHLLDREGYYYCFGCQAKGDVVNFVRETENLSFIEAVERLAGIAGMTMPAADPRAAERAKARRGLADIVELAVQFYRLQLRTGAAAAARAALQQRGIAGSAEAAFELGYAPPARAALFEHLSAKGVAPAEIVAAGLSVIPEDGGAPYDRFRDRIMFPIRDAKGAAIGFGGRAMAKEARAKYLNSPETALFDKGRTLYNIAPARAAVGPDTPLIVAEGYIDVIALCEAGFPAAVAPLGTAITEDQLALLWRMADEPVVALDGDRAGLRAAMRLVDLALPRLAPGKSLRFCLLPEGLDPDDLIRARGAGAMAALIAGAQPMVDMLWRKETEGRTLDSPERRAALDQALRRAIAGIADPSIRHHYGRAIRDLRDTAFARARPNRWSRNTPRAPAGPVEATRASLLAQPETQGADTRLRESLLLAGCLNHPDVAEALEPELEEIAMQSADLDEIRRALLAGLGDEGDLRAATSKRLGRDPFDIISENPLVALTPALHPGADPAMARRTLTEILDRQRALAGHLAEVRDAEAEVEGVADEGLTHRLKASYEMRARTETGALSDASDQDEEARARAELRAHFERVTGKSGAS
ncbi:MAG: DNA primase, partial [Pseudomonadota bacterium]